MHSLLLNPATCGPSAPALAASDTSFALEQYQQKWEPVLRVELRLNEEMKLFG